MKRNKNIVSNIISIVLIGIILFSIFKIGTWFIDNYKNNKIINSFKDIGEKVDKLKIDKIKEEKISLKKLKKQNKDTIAWIKVNNTNINYPVVKTNNNDYYLNHNFNKEYNSAGWIFMDYRNKIDGNDKNIVIYGHNRKDKSMFGSLSNILDKEWYTNKKNKTILLVTEKEIQKYEVYSIYEVKVEDYYITTDFSNDTYKEFINKVSKRSYYKFDTKVDVNNETLTLSTCSSNDKYRTVLHAIRKTN